MNTSPVSADIVAALISLLLAVSSALGAYLVALIRRRVSATNIGIAQNIARVAVTAVEQMGDAAGWAPQKKLDQALQAVKNLGEKHGINLNEPQWRSLIESEVAQLKRFGALLTTPDGDGTPTPVIPVVPVPVEPETPTPEDAPAAPTLTPAQEQAASLRAQAADLMTQADQLDPAPAS